MMKKTYSVLSLTLLFALGGPAALAACDDEAQYGEVSLTELKKLVATKSAVIVDVNSKSSFAKNHVPGALHFAAVEDKFAASLPKDKSSLVVAYCGGPMCTAWTKAAEAACALGYTNVKHFKGGISEWVKAEKKG